MKKILMFMSIIALIFCSLCICASATQASGIQNNAVYNIVNQNSGKYLNVHMGNDVNNTNVYQWTSDGSIEQQFRFVYDSTQDAYRIYAMCSSNGTNKVLDIVKTNGSVVSGCNVQIYNPVDNVAQLWIITRLSNGKYKISPKSNTAVALTTYGISNGTSSGTTSTSSGNAFVSTYTGASNQLWTFSMVNSGGDIDVNWSYMFRDDKMATRVSQGYNSEHYGVDIVHSTPGEIANDYPLYSVGSGKVMVSNDSQSAGYYVAITLNDGYTVRYLHMKNLPSVNVGDSVNSLTELGLVGNTGNSTGAHLHFDVNNVGALAGGDGPGFVNYSTTLNPLLFFPDIQFTY